MNKRSLTIVGGQPEGYRTPSNILPEGIQKLVHAATQDEQFKKQFLADPHGAAKEKGFTLTDSESRILKAVKPSLLEVFIRKISLPSVGRFVQAAGLASAALTSAAFLQDASAQEPIPPGAGGGVRADITVKALREKKVNLLTEGGVLDVLYCEPGIFKSAGFVMISNDQKDSSELRSLLHQRTRYGVLHLPGCKNPETDLASWLDAATKFYGSEKMVHSNCIVPVCYGKAAEPALKYAADGEKSGRLAGLVLISPEVSDENKLGKLDLKMPVLVVNGGKVGELLKNSINGNVKIISGQEGDSMAMAVVSWLVTARNAKVTPPHPDMPSVVKGIRPAGIRPADM